MSNPLNKFEGLDDDFHDVWHITDREAVFVQAMPEAVAFIKAAHEYFDNYDGAPDNTWSAPDEMEMRETLYTLIEKLEGGL